MCNGEAMLGVCNREAMLGGYPPYVPWWVCTPCICLPLHLPGYMHTPPTATLTLQQCLRDGLTALRRAVTERTVTDASLTVRHPSEHQHS